MLKYIDIHAHLNFPDFDEDREALISSMKKEGMGAINVGTDYKTSVEVCQLASEHENLWAIIGQHPHDAEVSFEAEEFKALVKENSKVVAIGECGLDYFRLEDDSVKEKQKKLFEKQIELALELDLPLMLHIRDSYEDVLDILGNFPEVRAHAHFFAGDFNIAKKFFDRGSTISFTGVITFASQYNEVVKNSPLDMIMAETDCPYVAPAPYRGQRNQPPYVLEVYKKIAEIRGENEETIREALTSNAHRIFNL